MHLPSYSFTAQAALTIFSSTILAQYNLEDDYSASAFASMFDFFTGVDPTSGYVNYVSQSQAESEGLFSANNGSVFIGVDSKNVASGQGRDSVRLSSTKSYNHGLIILDLDHMPGGQCGTWPAFWTLGPNWPDSGEIDIIENVNSATTNQMTAHTDSGCSITSTGNFAGTLLTPNCDVNAPNQATNAGCSIKTSNTETYGSGFNAAGGGVYATEWTSQGISIWFFPRSAIPADISIGSPNPTNWGLPVAQFTGGCDIDDHFFNQQIMFDITFCGQWAGQVWSTDATCSPLASTCQDYVQNNPSAFTETFWTINSLKVYQESGQAQPSSTSSSSSSVSASTTTSIATSSSTATTFSTATLSSTTPAAPTTTSSLPTPSTSTFTTYSAPTTYTQTIYTQTTYTNTWSTNTWSTNTWTNTWPTQSNTWSAPPAASATQTWGGWSGGQSGWGQGGGGGNGWGGRSGPPK